MSKPQTKKAKRSVGRPTIEHVRDHYISVRFTAAEKISVLKNARRSGASDVSEFLRARGLRKNLRTRKPARPMDDDALELAEVLRRGWHDLRRIGVNLNQIARHCNTHRSPPPPEFHELIAALLTLMKKLVAP